MDPIDQAPSPDLDWVRQQLVALDAAERALNRSDIAARDSVLRVADVLRKLLRAGNAKGLRHARDQWSARSGHKGEHEVDVDAIAGWAASMQPSSDQ